VKRTEPTLIAAGLVTVALGTLFLLDRLEVIDVRFGYAMPAVVAAVGVVLLVAGVTSSGGRPPAKPSGDGRGDRPAR
jgi:uncharacterized membrane protein YidH (DUF202 family)